MLEFLALLNYKPPSANQTIDPYAQLNMYTLSMNASTEAGTEGKRRTSLFVLLLLDFSLPSVFFVLFQGLPFVIPFNGSCPPGRSSIRYSSGFCSACPSLRREHMWRPSCGRGRARGDVGRNRWMKATSSVCPSLPLSVALLSRQFNGSRLVSYPPSSSPLIPLPVFPSLIVFFPFCFHCLHSPLFPSS